MYAGYEFVKNVGAGTGATGMILPIPVCCHLRIRTSSILNYVMNIFFNRGISFSRKTFDVKSHTINIIIHGTK